MLLHIGNGKTVRGEEIIGIFDLDNATIAKDSRTYLSRATKAGEVSYADSDIPRAFIVTAKTRKMNIGVLREEPAFFAGRKQAPNAFRCAGKNKTESRPRHPARAKKQKSPPPSQWVHLSHVSSTALHARTERPFDED